MVDYVSDEDDSDEGEYFYPSGKLLSVPDSDDDKDDDGGDENEESEEKPQTAKSSKKKSQTKSKKKKSKKSVADVVTGLLDMPSPVKKTNRRLSFPLHRADMEDEDGDAVGCVSEELTLERSALHEDDDVDADAEFQVMTPSGRHKLHRSTSMDSSPGTKMSSSQRRKASQPKASGSKNGKLWVMSPSPSVSIRKSSNDDLTTPESQRKPHSFSVARTRKSADGAGLGKNEPPNRRRSTAMHDDLPNGQPPPRQRSMTTGGSGATNNRKPMRRGSTMVDEDGIPKPPTIRVRGSTMDAVKEPTRRKSTMDATFSWQPRKPQQASRRRSSMSSMKPNDDATALFYADPFAKTSTKTQLEQGKKIEEERVTRRNSLPSASQLSVDRQPDPQTPKLRHSKSQDFELFSPTANGDDDPYDEEGNLIRRKAPRRRSVTNTPQRFNAVDPGTAPIITPPNTSSKVRMEHNLKEAMLIDPFEATDEALVNSERSSKSFPSEEKMRSSTKKTKTKAKGNLKDHLRKSGSNGQKEGKEAASMGSKNSVQTTSTAGSTDPSNDSQQFNAGTMHTSDFKRFKPRIEALKGGEEKQSKDNRKGRSSLDDSGGSSGPRRGSRNRRSSPKRASEGSAKVRARPEPPNRTKSDAGPRAIRISMTGDVDLLSNAESKEPSIRRRRLSIDKDEECFAKEETNPDLAESKSMDAMPITRTSSDHQEEPPKRKSSGSTRRRRLSIGAKTQAGPRTSKSPSPRKPIISHRLTGRRNSMF